MNRVRNRQELQLAAAMWRAAPAVTAGWWVLMLLRAALPALLAIAIGTLVGAVDRGDALTGPLSFVGVVFVALQVLPPLHQWSSSAVGARLAASLNERLMQASVAPPGIGHLERPDLANDLTTARDFDLGITGPPLHIGMDFVANSLAELLGGIAATLVLFGFAWWAPPLLLVGWGCTHWLLRESGVWKDRLTDEVQLAQRHTDYAYRLAVDPPAAKEIRLFGLAPWLIERFSTARSRLHDLRWEATKLRERSVLGCLLVVLAANGIVCVAIAVRARDGDLDVARVVVFAQSLFAASAIAFGGLNWALDGAAAPVAAVTRLERTMHDAGALDGNGSVDATDLPRGEIRFRNVTFAYPSTEREVLRDFDLTIPAGSSLAIVGRNGAGKTTLAKLLCRLYDPQSGSIEIDGVDLRELDLTEWRRRITPVFQDFVRYEWPLRDNVLPPGLGAGAAADAVLQAALDDAGAGGLADASTILARGYPGGTELSGGQWQRIALARALAAVRSGAGVVLLDEPTAMLDVRGEMEIFERVLRATQHCTTILVSHRFSTVRLADRICVVEHGRVIELGTHDELVELGGRYRDMYEMQASRFTEVDETGTEVTYERL